MAGIPLDNKALLDPRGTLSSLYVSRMRLHGHRYEARAPKGPLVNRCCQGIEGRRLELGDVGGDGNTPEVCLLDQLVRLLEEQRDWTWLAHCAAHRGGCA